MKITTKRVFLGIVAIPILLIGGLVMYIWISCKVGNQEENLRLVITELAKELEKEYITYKTNTSYGIKTHMVQTIHKTLGCKLNYKTYGTYVAECRNEFTSYGIKDDNSTLSINVKKGRSTCSMQISMDMMDFKEHNMRKSFEYEKSCFTYNCIRLRQ